MRGKKFDLEDRTLAFSKRVFRMVKVLPRNQTNRMLTSQVLRSATSVGANYREANDALGDKDFLHRLRIARKESKETQYWLELVVEENPVLEKRMNTLIQENIELTKILSSIINKKKKKA